MTRKFIQLGNHLVREQDIESVDVSNLKDGRIVVLMRQQCKAIVVEGIQAFDAINQLHPSAVEGVRLTFGWNTWVVHNLVAHPLMQILAFARLHKAAFWVHDGTVPRAKGVKVSRTGNL